MTFEESLKKLEKITEKISDGNTSLDEALKFYEDGLECYKMCSDILKNTEQKIEVFKKGDVNCGQNI